MATLHSLTHLSISLTHLSISLTFFALVILRCSASMASEQLKFWSQNVDNKMPSSITKKLTPLTEKDTEFFSNMIVKNEFAADSKFCKLAHLACSSVFDTSKPESNEYSSHTKKTYDINSAVVSSEKTKDDPFSFFRLSVLKSGNNIHLPDLEESMPDRAFLPSAIASKVSLKSANKHYKIFSASSNLKKNIDATLGTCNAEAIEGEVKSCVKSLEEMILFSKSALGGRKLVSLTSKSTRGSNSVTKVSKIKKIVTDKIVACHEVFLPFATYFCHSISSSNLYVVDLVDVKSESPVNTMLAICHMDTSPWPVNHVAFRILKFGPGHGEACHWFTQLDLAWVAKEDKP